MGLLAKRYFYHLIYIAKIHNSTRLVMAKIKMVRCDYKVENEHMIEGSTKWKTNEKYSAKFILGCKLKFSNYSEAFPSIAWFFHVAICTPCNLILYCNCIFLVVCITSFWVLPICFWHD